MVCNFEFFGNGDRDFEGFDGFNLIGSLGRDVLSGFEGDDIYIGGWGRDIFEFCFIKGGDIFGDDFVVDFFGDWLWI